MQDEALMVRRFAQIGFVEERAQDRQAGLEVVLAVLFRVVFFEVMAQAEKALGGDGGGG